MSVWWAVVFLTVQSGLAGWVMVSKHGGKGGGTTPQQRQRQQLVARSDQRIREAKALGRNR